MIPRLFYAYASKLSPPVTAAEERVLARLFNAMHSEYGPRSIVLSRDELADRCSTTTRTLRRLTASLTTKGYLFVRAGSGWHNVYDLTPLLLALKTASTATWDAKVERVQRGMLEVVDGGQP